MERVAAFVTIAVLCAGCSSNAATDESGPSPVATPTSSPRPPAASDAPATASGPLTMAAFPAPASLGPGWSYRIDPGDPEGGYVGNGTPGLERDPREVTSLAVPLGCPRSGTLPAPAHAFEVDYAFRGRPVVAVRLEFRRAAQALGFASRRARDVRACRGRSGGVAVGPYVSRVRGPLNDRTPRSEPWVELALRRGKGVLLMAAATTWDAPPFTPGQVRRIRALVDAG